MILLDTQVLSFVTINTLHIFRSSETNVGVSLQVSFSWNNLTVPKPEVCHRGTGRLNFQQPWMRDP
jgi:hypothetical protein